MKELRQKQRMKQVLYSWFSLILLTVLTFFIAKGSVELMSKERESAKRLTALEFETEELEVRETELHNNIAKLGTEEGIIEEIRGKFGVTREGEYVAIIVDERSESASSSVVVDHPWYKKLWDAITRISANMTE